MQQEGNGGGRTAMNLLIVDDEEANLESLARLFRREGYLVRGAASGREAILALDREPADIVLTDLMMPGGIDGIDLLRAAKQVDPETEVIMMTAYGTVETAVESMKEGAYDFITKPFKKMHVLTVVERARERKKLKSEIRALKLELDRVGKGREIVGSSPAITRVLNVVAQAAPSTASILLEGESGTGKELFARAVHDLSPRREKPFVAVNCAALPETILESELFGYEKGAFTGAVARREGRFEAADGGTIFLDEVPELKPNVQAKLLRVLQSGEFERLGSNETLKVDVRIVAATNRNLFKLVAERSFREDLYYRLNVIHIRIPPLRERADDIPLLAGHFIKRFAAKNGKTVRGITPAGMNLLVNAEWRGNVRELENAIERAVVLGAGEMLDTGDFDTEARRTPAQAGGEKPYLMVPLGTTLDEIEQSVIAETLRMTGGDKNKAAEILGIATRTIYRKLVREE